MEPIRLYAFADEASSRIDGQIAAMRRNGLQGLEIRGVDGQNVADITPAKAREVKAKLDAAGLITWSVGSPIGKIGLTDDFAPHRDKFRRTLEIAQELGAANLRLFSFYIPEGADPDGCTGEAIDRLGALLEDAAGSGVRLCHENEKGIFGDTAARCRVLFDALPGLCGIFDPANFVQCGQDTLAAWELLGDRIAYLHIKDSLPDGRVVPAGQGAGNLAAVTAAYRARGGRDCTMEPHLTVFDGLAGLEKEGDTSVIDAFAYPDSDTAFDAACRAFRSLLTD